MRRILVLLMALMLCTSSASADYWRVFDNAGLFSAEDVETIEQAIADFQRTTNTDFAVLTFEGFFGNNISGEIAELFYEYNDFGFGHTASGIVYFFHLYDGLLYANFGLKGETNASVDEETHHSIAVSCRQFITEGNYTSAVLYLIDSAKEAVIEYKKGR